MIIFKRLVSIIIINAILVSCSSLSQQNIELPHTGIAIEHSGKNWWYARFRIRWPEDEEPRWYIDALLAHQVIKPVILLHRDQIDIWRFHRRAGRKGGHLFSFIFYADSDLAATIYQEISASEILSELLDETDIEKYITEDRSKMTRPNIEDTSDRNWNEIIQKSWPYYIMGVSEMWLEMISLLVNLNQDESSSKQELFRQIHDNLTVLWKNEGGHAFLHHLNALFAYKPVAITETTRRLTQY